MKVYCLYNKDYHRFINEIVEQILTVYGSQLKLGTLEEIELVDKNEMLSISDGKILGSSKIIISSRIPDLLTTYNVSSLYSNNDYKIFKRTIFHEMNHITDMVVMPKLYNNAFYNKNIKYYLPSLFWTEYIVEKRTFSFEDVNDTKLCDTFVKISWACNMYKRYENYCKNNFFYLVKLLSYFLARTHSPEVRKEYLYKINNQLVKQFINELDKELKDLESKDLFDDVVTLFSLFEILDKYYRLFIRIYK
ncbi:hypothetical protein [Kineothrix sp. MB12-C1]|uniref:hypothetical protein n=1 Tax=Kineothrix sp. MB12-C1 TaxID=3070215 RepID=UPI0027D22B44|nr:hypothetical protein [Kineothrix sp. MB12-C1]WMC93215.1 hypothetical protein RBB56_02715 [Kineothrix sp. MB12-C1]